MTTRIWIVVDLGFGDSGKGTIVDYLVRAKGAGLVVRWNGGAQAGHAVVTDDGRAHVFSQLGAGTFVRGVRTHLDEPFVLHPTALLVEARHLSEKGVGDALDRLTIAGRARVITPIHQAANRVRELARGARRHGTCGVGFGEAVRDSLEAGHDVVRAHDLVLDRPSLRRKLARARDRLVASLGESVRAVRTEPAAAGELAVLFDESVDERWLDQLESLRARRGLIVDAGDLGVMLRGQVTVLEGAQGILLDERYGFHPHTTWSDCTTTAASALLARHGHSEHVERVGVMRTYLTRHGEGPFPSEAPDLFPRLLEAHNDHRGWQGAFRVGHQDLVLLRYAIRVSGGIDAVALTHADRLREVSSLVTAYEGGDDRSLFAHDARNHAIGLRPAGDLDLAHQERLGRALRGVRPLREGIEPSIDAFAERIEAELRTRVAIVSSGPTAGAKRGR